jgi:DNA-directed RNA polymerase specialized sigma24 family protein
MIVVTDEQLLLAAAAGDDRAFAVFYRRHVDALIAFFRGRVPTPEQAFDLAAETLAIVALRPRDYRGEGPAVAWLYGIARNVLRSSLRQGRIEDAARRRLGAEPTPLTDADLPAAMRQALLARVVEERDYPDIADELGCSEHVVRQRVSRGLARLRAGLEQAR